MCVSLFGGIFVPLMTRAMANSGDIHPDLESDTNNQNEAALLAMTLLGAGEILGGTIIGNIRDRTSNRTAFIFEIML